MTKGRDNAAESVKDVFVLIRSRKQSGVLSIERFANGQFEEGEVHFQVGKPIQASVGKLNGEVALHHLLSWRRVYFSFSSTSTSSNAETVRSSPQVISTPLSSHTTQQQVTSPDPHDVASLVPHKAANSQDVMSLSLTRPQRTMYLLIDGRRNVSDLGRFTGKRIPEVLQILVDLRARELISM